MAAKGLVDWCIHVGKDCPISDNKPFDWTKCLPDNKLYPERPTMHLGSEDVIDLRGTLG
jgi:hypothetical protein